MSMSARTILSGFALATSWTWCIGMFAPILIGSLLGWPGIVAFAIPNILGCALFGYLRSAEQSRRETRDHALAMALFSGATVAYQVFFAGFLWGAPLAESMQATRGEGASIAAGGVFAAAVALAALPRGVLWTLAALAYPISLATFALLPWDRLHGIQTVGEWQPGQLWLVLPTIVFGFMLSPNLDLTFHRARQEVPAGTAPHNFAVFGVTFGSMLALTCAYAAIGGGLNSPAVRAHMAVQLALTSALHLSELRLAAVGPKVRLAIGLGAGLAGLGAALFDPSRDMYMRFLGLYGLLFPAYAALALRVGGRPSPRALAALAVALAVSTPIIDRAFLEGPTLAAPLAVVLPLLAIVPFGRRARPIAA
ncbi:MAG: hypothetical protein RL136_1792 [Planctomycetota bacterium]|jgi:hypothetical protein